MIESSIWTKRTGYALTGIAGLFFVMDAVMKLLQLPVVFETMAQLGWPTSSVMPLAVILLVGTILYLVPRTSVLGAVLLTGYLGGAIATHARIGSPLLTHTLFGAYMGVVMWGGLYLRDAALRAIFPVR